MTESAAGGAYRVALPEFEGPLDLLLHLCKTHELDIVNIPISFVTQKYLEYLDMMQSMSVEVAADYLVMAATLAYLKSRELVPAPEPMEATEGEGEEVVDPRAELIRRLLEYQKYKDAAEQLGERPIEGRNVFGRGMPVDPVDGPAPLADQSMWKLIEAFSRLLEKASPKVTHEVVFDRVSISARINQIIDRLEGGGGSFRFDALFDLSVPEPDLRSQIVVTLLAILELARLKVVRVLASEDHETLFITQVAGAELSEARRAEVTSGDEPEPEPEPAAVEADAEPVDARDSVETTEPVDTMAAVETTEATEPVDAMDSVETTEPVDTMAAVETTEATEAIDAAAEGSGAPQDAQTHEDQQREDQDHEDKQRP